MGRSACASRPREDSMRVLLLKQNFKASLTRGVPLQRSRNVERDALRERERQARAQRAGLGAGETGGHPIFRAPIKVDPGQEDEISRRIKSTLGDFSQVQRLLTHDPNHLIGISRTNAALSSSRGGSSSVPPSSAGPVTSAPPGPAPTNGVGSNASTWNGTATGRPDRTEDNPSERPKPAAPPPNGLVVRPPAMRVPSKDVNNGASSASHSSSNTSSSLTVRTESNGPVNSGGKAVAPASRPTAASSAVVEAKAKRPPPPRLQLPSHATDAAEMKKVPPALTAIETPRKEDCRPYFPPSPVQEPLLNHLDENGDSKSLLDSRKAASPP
ncbi:hypothetical protein IscW_ISCW004068 [Ixodes scapularis]|uniref:Uncharacterized protein n=1 Tax=Ixodes scapularis TaxID=6945 RepID=B7PJY1_IXOSC|nr:hypothetical protein IscW_ISCW004068 [Ixodes scapularis]|eukprot:XP_002408843.1 hypothetical protein IscW_ISCW004068 [Ixodes scapularis]